MFILIFQYCYLNFIIKFIHYLKIVSHLRNLLAYYYGIKEDVLIFNY